MSVAPATSHHPGPRCGSGSDTWFINGLLVILIFAVLTTWVPARWPVAAEQAGIFALAIAWNVRQIVSRRPIVTSWVLIPLGLAAVWGPAQLIFGLTVYRFATLLNAMNWFTWFALFFLALQLFARAENRGVFRERTRWFAAVLGVFSLLQFYTSQGKILWLVPNGYYPRILGPFVNRDHYSALMELLLPVVVAGIRRRRSAVWYWIAAACMFASGIAGASRAGAVLCLLAFGATLLLVYARRKLSFGAPFRTALAGASSVVLLTLAVGCGTVLDRFAEPDPFFGRRELNIASMRMTLERPGSGFGLGTWTYVYPAYAVLSSREFANAAHNDWAQFAVEGGVAFPLVLLSIVVWAVRQGLRFPWGLGPAFLFIHAAVDFPLQIPCLALWTFAITGALAAASVTQPRSHDAGTSG